MTDILRLVTNETLPSGLTTDDVAVLRTRIGHTFQEAQKSVATHRKLLATLKTLQETAGKAQIEKVFNALFVKALTRALPVKKGEKTADRIIKFCESFIIFISAPISSDEDNDDQVPSTVSSRFVQYIIHFLIQGTEAKDKNVRYRVCQLLAVALAKVGELNDDLFSLVKERLIRRSHDKEQNVRLQAILALVAIQDLEDTEEDCAQSINKILSWAVCYDSSAEVRRAALLNLQVTPANVPLLIQRIRDVNYLNRRAVYTHVLNESTDYRALSIGMRESVLLHGLQDRDDSVKTAAKRLLVNKWLPLAENDLVVLLERLDVLNSKVAELTLQTFFQERPDALEQVQIDENFWQVLSAESVFMVRVYNDHCIKEKRQDLIDAQMPELTKLAFMVEYYFAKLADKRNTEIEFILHQLLRMAATYDFGDEIGRRKTLGLMRDVLYNQEISDDLIQKCVEVIKKISINERDFALTCLEIISDLTEGQGKDEEEQEELPKPRRRSKRHRSELDEEGEGEEEEEEEGDSFHSAASSVGQTPPAETSRLEEQALHYYKCLVIAQCVLELAEQPLDSNIQLKNMVDGVVLGAIHHPGGPIKEKALRCLGLACLLSRDMTVQYFGGFLTCANQVDGLQKLMLHIIGDILVVFGTSILPADIELTQLYQLYKRCAQNGEEPELQTLAAESLCKLLLGEVFTDTGLLQVLLSAYYENSSDSQSALRQILSFCLPVYCFSSVENQTRLGQVVVPSIKTLGEKYDPDEDTITPVQAMQQLVDWTDPRRVVAQDAQSAGSSMVHVQLARDILDRLKLTYSRDERKALCSVLGKLYLPSDLGEEVYGEMRKLIGEIGEAKIVTEALLKNQIDKFDATLLKRQQAALNGQLIQEADLSNISTSTTTTTVSRQSTVAA